MKTKKTARDIDIENIKSKNLELAGLKERSGGWGGRDKKITRTYRIAPGLVGKLGYIFNQSSDDNMNLVVLNYVTKWELANAQIPFEEYDRYVRRGVQRALSRTEFECLK